MRNQKTLSDLGQITHDIFDCSTGYGMRPLTIDGTDIWANDAEEAFDLMERHVEAQGRIILNKALTDELGLQEFPKAMNAQAEIDQIMQSNA